MLRYIIAISVLLLSVDSLAQGSISGVVSSAEEKLPFVYVTIESLQLATTTDKAGKFELTGIPEGTHVVVAQFLGYKRYSKQIFITNDQEFKLAINLQPEILGLDEITVTANRTEESKKSSTVIVNSLNKAQLENLGATTFSDGIKFSPGVRTETNCQNCGFSQVRINGLPGTYSQVLIDGRPTYSALNSIYGLDQIPIEMIERIEVVKGGNSAMYGSSAIAGTINIITTDPVKNSASIRSESGLIGGKSFEQTFGGQGSMVSSQFKHGVIAFGNYRFRQFYDHNGDGYSELPTLENLSAGARGFVKTGNFGKLNIELHAMKEYRRGGDSIHLEPHEANIAEELNSEVLGGGLSYDFFSNNKHSKFNLYSSFQNTNMNNYYGAEKDANGYGKTSDFSLVSGMQWRNEHTGLFNGKNNWVSGVEYKLNDMKDEKPGYGLFVDQNLRTLGVFSQYESFLLSRRLKLSIGARYDWFNLNNSHNISPRANALFHVNPQISLRAGYARGFRIPQVFSEDVHVELVAGEVQAIRLSPSLSAELSDSFTASLDWDKELKKGEFEVVLEGFFTLINNPFVLEEVDQNGLSVLERRNGPAARVYGGTIEFKITDQKKVALQSSFTALQSIYSEPVQWSSEAASDQITKHFLRTPNFYGNASIDYYATKKLTVVTTLLYTGQMKVEHFAGYIPVDKLETTPQFVDVGLKATYKFTLGKINSLAATIGVKNILNAYQSDFDKGLYRDASYVYGPQQPRTFYAGLKFSLN